MLYCSVAVDGGSEGNDRRASYSASEDRACGYKNARVIREGSTTCQLLGRQTEVSIATQVTKCIIAFGFAREWMVVALERPCFHSDLSNLPFVTICRIGAVLTGVVSNIRDYGAFVTLPVRDQCCMIIVLLH